MTANTTTGFGFGFHAGMTRNQALRVLRQRLTSAAIATPGLDARLLCAFSLGIDGTELLAHDDIAITAVETAALDGNCARRLAGEPIARIIGEREFWGLPFQLSPQTLEPRPDTETLIEAVLETIHDRRAPLRILDLGTGTGCILIALLTELVNTTGLGADISSDAIAVAARNAARNGVSDRISFVVSDWLASVEGQFDLVVSNPPYIRSDVIDGLDREVRNFDPPRALDGGMDGLAAYRSILKACRPYLRDDGLVALEIGFDQKKDVETIACDCDFRLVAYKEDLSGHARVVILRANIR